jgi:hypothetical protein
MTGQELAAFLRQVADQVEGLDRVNGTAEWRKDHTPLLRWAVREPVGDEYRLNVNVHASWFKSRKEQEAE